MKSHQCDKTAKSEIRPNRRLTERVPTEVALMYSGMAAGDMLIGDGLVTDMSDRGIGIRGNRLVNPNMNLSLYIDLPGADEPVCIAQTKVAWVSGRQFGVEMISWDLEAQNQLRFHVWNCATRARHTGY
ncbi:hypothetical protein W02_29450 [Nitrospira sp. KM1]|uniref:PilZ domain-containing protein n=1 Tax=Nitrospira sp. KM1 TaxID=1936990 RepID=UPI0013A76065|nr:PilZ domain-containing protein [Nitrospira sp. KM1]BCA55805.1 hypothetical protein W02_29450 [Nitrospira sp. KM1]